MTENVFTAMAEQVRAALVALYPELPADILARVQVEPPRDAAHGDMATNAALVIAKPARLPPAKIAAALVEKLGALPMVEAAEAAGVLFYPINPGHEEASWERLYREALPRFFAGTYAGPYMAACITEFEALLPAEPAWPVAKV